MYKNSDDPTPHQPIVSIVQYRLQLPEGLVAHRAGLFKMLCPASLEHGFYKLLQSAGYPANSQSAKCQV